MNMLHASHACAVHLTSEGSGVKTSMAASAQGLSVSSSTRHRYSPKKSPNLYSSSRDISFRKNSLQSLQRSQNQVGQSSARTSLSISADYIWSLVLDKTKCDIDLPVEACNDIGDTFCLTEAIRDQEKGRHVQRHALLSGVTNYNCGDDGVLVPERCIDMVVAGANPEADLCICCRQTVSPISGVHAVFELSGPEKEHLYIVDLDSDNGTYIDDVLIAPMTKIELHPGQKLSIAMTAEFEVQRNISAHA